MRGTSAGVPMQSVQIYCAANVPHNDTAWQTYPPHTTTGTSHTAQSHTTYSTNATPNKTHNTDTHHTKYTRQSQRVCLPGVLGIQITVPAIHPNALPPNTIPSPGPGTLSTNDTTKHNYRQTENFHSLFCDNRNFYRGLCSNQIMLGVL